MAVDGENLVEYSYRVGLGSFGRIKQLDSIIDRKTEYPKSALRLLTEVEERRRLETEKKLAEKKQETEKILKDLERKS